MRAGCNHIVPSGFSPHMARDDMIDGEIGGLTTAILAGVVVSAEDFLAVEFDNGTGALDHSFKPDHGGQRESL